MQFGKLETEFEFCAAALAGDNSSTAASSHNKTQQKTFRIRKDNSVGTVRYEALTAEEFVAKKSDGHFDAVLASVVVEHVDNPSLFIRA